jgi:hypothetical protein
VEVDFEERLEAEKKLRMDVEAQLEEEERARRNLQELLEAEERARREMQEQIAGECVVGEARARASEVTHRRFADPRLCCLPTHLRQGARTYTPSRAAHRSGPKRRGTRAAVYQVAHGHRRLANAAAPERGESSKA